MRLPYCETGPGLGQPEVFPAFHQEEISDQKPSQLPDNIQQDNANFKVPVSIGICKQCKKFYSPEVWSISLLCCGS